MPSKNAILAGMAMARKRLATAAGLSRACNNRSSAGSRSSNMATDNAVAEIAMVRPIETDSARNCSWLA
jgi:hypothetical protein